MATVALVAVVASHLVDFGTDNLRIGFFDAQSSGSWSHILVAAAIVGSTASAVVGARRSPRHRSVWIAATVILAFLAIDELTPLHAKVDEMSWGKVLYTPILLALCWCLWRLSDWSEAGTVVRVGLATLIVSFAIHVFGPHVVSALGWGTDSWPYQIKIALKQGTELAGWLLILIGLWRLVSRHSPETNETGGRSSRAY